jgi:hypothetical protein
MFCRHVSLNTSLSLSLLSQVVPFDQRVDVFQSLLNIDKANFFSSAGGDGAMAAIGKISSRIFLKIRQFQGLYLSSAR